MRYQSNEINANCITYENDCILFSLLLLHFFLFASLCWQNEWIGNLLITYVSCFLRVSSDFILVAVFLFCFVYIFVCAKCICHLTLAQASMLMPSMWLHMNKSIYCGLAGGVISSPSPEPGSPFVLFSFFHFIRRFWNQILICRSVRHNAWAISMRRLRVR